MKHFKIAPKIEEISPRVTVELWLPVGVKLCVGEFTLILPLSSLQNLANWLAVNELINVTEGTYR